ncbi:sulfurtransferase complex subunit TusD [Rheinheimera sp. MMS21-TC3]|uniref:sulfurtransferase complex subunit TusD n=1 Tax=Rheinheimera sp. MMS21-TC3 TaxID=3072790 RepID=UPI0028C47725|nr:sulfurtransferase complex subunit TusD [Rheinheimera sp. MMS21-TC3]WNO60918.1 sulfurtransferase complex subunit TusD [Rheinheimera sp. MMS21-TC3]
MTRFALFITSASFNSQTISSALVFANALLEAGHQLKQVFLYQDAVYAALQHIDLPSDEFNHSLLLSRFCQQHAIGLHYCITAAEKRGVVSNELAAQQGYMATGLAEFAILLEDIDKLVQF